MRSFEIFVEPEPQTPSSALAPRETAEAAAPSSHGRRGVPVPREVLDIFIQGTNVTASVDERNATCVLRDLASALVGLVGATRGKAIVRFYDDGWELVVERFAQTALLSIYRAGGEPRVLVHERPVIFQEVRASVLDALGRTLARPGLAAPLALELRTLLEALTMAEDHASGVESPVPTAAPVALEIDRDAPISLAAEFLLRPGPCAAVETSVERADLHALLFKGKMRAEIRGRAVELGEAAPFLVAERFLELGKSALSAWERGQAFHVRASAGGLLVGLRLEIDARSSTDDGNVALVLGAGADGKGRERGIYTFPSLSVTDVVEAALAFGRGLVRVLLRRDRSQGMNLRLSDFRRQLREVADALREVKRTDSLINPAPESYRAFAHRNMQRPGDATLPPARLRYAPKWRALVPGIDLRATFLCGDHIIVGAATETYCLNRATGEVLWRTRTERATSVVTPSGIARIGVDGAVCVHDFGTGEITLRAWLAARTTGPCAGAVVSSPGLPRLLIVTEGERHLVALDLTTGEARWRYAWGKGALRLKRAGKLLYVASGESSLTALDVSTGAVVWRVRDRLRFRSNPTVDPHELYALAGGVNSTSNLHSIDPFSGEIRYSRSIGGSGTVEGAPLVTRDSVVLAMRERDGLHMVGHDRATGAPRFRTRGAIAPIGTSWLAVDDLLVGNTPTGELVALDAGAGTIRYRHTLGRASESDTPRRLEPVLRSGALFVPSSDVHVFRPHDGVALGTVGPCDAIPDLLRVDERCDVYVAEESGHMAAFAVGSRLSLVK